ncbi:type II toxin-antitoxin system VapC family toxin [Bradyrhizobium roseum]|uniref:type II toxin-antitoxin system VapC family toxin n=1 Tax=Bradyrhizobium roseum TaxID=3056648 RepID=UPI002639A02B|nr:hypothetical protein [Bradyrhizobium roseus]WKA27823.1 hypothetical protein QUH67_30375 [Bradyrhizobium roseus]
MIEHFYWDSCIFYCLLTGQPPHHQADVLELLNDARNGKAKIYTSTIALAEIKPRFLKQKGHRSINAFFDTMQGAVSLIDANPNIMTAAGILRDCIPTNPSDATTQNLRSIGLGDAIHLQTCLHLRDVLGVKGIVFQTFDNGKGKTWEGRCVPLLTFEKWFPQPPKSVADVCSLTRILPRSTQSNLFTTPAIGAGTPALISGGNTPAKPS